MNEINISRYTASNIVKEYLKNYYSNIVTIKVKSKLENNDLIMVVKKQSKLRGRNITITENLNEGKISDIIKKYMEMNNCFIDNIMFEPYFHNLNIRYHGNKFEIFNNKKGYEKVLVG